jgi:hypothetical protein
MLDFLIGEYRGEVIKRHTRKATSYLNSVALETSFIIYNTYFYTSIPYPFPFKVILYPKENVSFFLDDLNDWIRPWLFLSRGSSIMWSQSLIPIGPWVAYLALIVYFHILITISSLCLSTFEVSLYIWYDKVF